MKFTFHKCVRNVIAAPNPTQQTKSGKYKKEIDIGSKIDLYIGLRVLLRRRASAASTTIPEAQALMKSAAAHTGNRTSVQTLQLAGQ